LDEFGTPDAVGFGYFILNKQPIGPGVKLETSDDDSDTDDDNNKTLHPPGYEEKSGKR
jgi:hypothetical protein